MHAMEPVPAIHFRVLAQATSSSVRQPPAAHFLIQATPSGLLCVQVQNIRPGFKWGLWLGLANAALETYIFPLLFGGPAWRLSHNQPDHNATMRASQCKPIEYDPYGSSFRQNCCKHCFLHVSTAAIRRTWQSCTAGRFNTQIANLMGTWRLQAGWRGDLRCGNVPPPLWHRP